MRKDILKSLDLGVKPKSVGGLVESILNAPCGDIWPRGAVMGIGGMVKYTEKGRVVEVKVVEIDPKVKIGDLVWVNKVGEVVRRMHG